MIIYQDDKMKLRVGDRLIFRPPENKETRFACSRIGKIFNDGLADCCEITVQQEPWLEIVFDVVLYKQGVPVMESGHFVDYKDAKIRAHGYQFLRYLLQSPCVLEHNDKIEARH